MEAASLRRRLLSAALLSALALSRAGAAGAPRRRRPTPLRAFADKVLKTGKDDELDEVYARLYQTAPCSTKRRSYAGKRTTDGLDHEATVTLESAPRTGRPRARELLLAVYEKSGREGIEYGFRLSLEGKIERAFMTRGRLLDPRAPVIDAQLLNPRSSDLDVGAPDVKARARHELDFWVKGLYRKTPAKRPA